MGLQGLGEVKGACSWLWVLDWCGLNRYFLTAQTRKNRLVVDVPYSPGLAAVQLIRSSLCSSLISTGPALSAGTTTEVEGTVDSSVGRVMIW